MLSPAPPLFRSVWSACLAGVLVLFTGGAVLAQSHQDDPAQTRAALAEAQNEAEAARHRAEALETTAQGANAAADLSARQAAAIAARIQQTEAQIAADELAMQAIAHQQGQLRARLAARQQPLLQLTAALQRMARRPLIVALLRPGSVRDAMHMRALLETLLPEITRRTAALRTEIADARRLQTQALTARQALAAQTRTLNQQRQALVALGMRQRLAARNSRGSATREAEQALALAEQASDLGALVTELDKAAALGERLALLPGPVPRPVFPAQAQSPAADLPPPAPVGLVDYMLPVAGRLLTGFGESRHGEPPAQGLSIIPRRAAQVVAPAAGRVAFAGAYPGYGQIVILSHPGGWTSLVTGLAQSDVRVGDSLLAGAPLGMTAPGGSLLTVELRKAGLPVNPLDQVRRK